MISMAMAAALLWLRLVSPRDRILSRAKSKSLSTKLLR
jgi:hypothetical protein